MELQANSEKIALLSDTQAPTEEDDTINYGAIIGSSLAVFGAAAIYAVRRNMKKDNDFERQY